MLDHAHVLTALRLAIDEESQMPDDAWYRGRVSALRYAVDLLGGYEPFYTVDEPHRTVYLDDGLMDHAGQVYDRCMVRPL